MAYKFFFVISVVGMNFLYLFSSIYEEKACVKFMG